VMDVAELVAQAL